MLVHLNPNGPTFEYSWFDFSKLTDAPVVLVDYARDSSIVNDSHVRYQFYWQSYRTPEGEISISKNAYKALPDETFYTAKYLNELFRSRVGKTNSPELAVERVQFVRTRGNVGVHIDQKSRRSSINIGLKNTGTAITRIYNSDSTDPSTLSEPHDYHCVDGGCYLLNTSKAHSVMGTDDVRLLVSYGFYAPYGLIRTALT